MLKQLISLACLATALPLSAQAAGTGLSAQIGTLGAGLNLAYGVNDHLSVRLNANAFSYDYSGKEEDLDYRIEPDLQTAGILADWFPFGGTFRISSGLYYNNSSISMVAEPGANGTYTINDREYDEDEIGNLRAKGKIGDSKLAPYLGLGLGHLGGKSGFSFTADVGVMYVGRSSVDLSGECGPALPLVACAQLHRDIQAEEDDINDSADDKFYRKLYPVISLGIGYTF